MHRNKINGKVYIGQTCDIKHRWQPKCYQTSSYFYNAIEKYGWENFEHIILEDNLTLENVDEKENYYINKFNSPAIIIEFIGGEPLLEIKLTRQIYEYFLKRCYELNHPWFKLHRVSICSNGLQYFDQDVQDFFKDYFDVDHF